MSSFVATAYAAEEFEDLNAFVVVLAERSDGAGARLEIQRALGYDSQDQTLGMDTYCLCNHLGMTHYGGVLSWRIRDGLLYLSLDQAAAAALVAKTEMSIELRLPELDVESVSAAVERALQIPETA
jgi:hypothetical protein